MPAKLVTLISELKETRAGDIWALNYIIALVYQLPVSSFVIPSDAPSAPMTHSRESVVSPG